MSEHQGSRGIVVAHGTMAEGLVDAVRRIAGGAADALTPVSNEGRTPQELRDILERLAGKEPVVIFVDLVSGSCSMAALVSLRESTDRAVVCGVNLPVLLDFVFHRDLPLDELVPRIVGKGKDGIRQLPEAS
ncbi:MAG: PTS fructose transporter subunit IIA [Gemmatimonadota bacterium]|jgi:mannose/fructose-specific phosphotransferase system component IIA